MNSLSSIDLAKMFSSLPNFSFEILPEGKVAISEKENQSGTGPVIEDVTDSIEKSVELVAEEKKEESVPNLLTDMIKKGVEEQLKEKEGDVAEIRCVRTEREEKIVDVSLEQKQEFSLSNALEIISTKILKSIEDLSKLDPDNEDVKRVKQDQEALLQKVLDEQKKS